MDLLSIEWEEGRASCWGGASLHGNDQNGFLWLSAESGGSQEPLFITWSLSRYNAHPILENTHLLQVTYVIRSWSWARNGCEFEQPTAEIAGFLWTRKTPIVKALAEMLSYITRKECSYQRWRKDNSEKTVALSPVPATIQGSQYQRQRREAILSICRARNSPPAIFFKSPFTPNCRLFLFALRTLLAPTWCKWWIASFCCHGTPTISCFEVLDILK